MPPLLRVLDLPGESPGVVDEVDQPLEPAGLDVIHPNLPQVPVSQRPEEHGLEHRAGDGEQQLVGLHCGAVPQLEGDVSVALKIFHWIKD